MMMFNQLNLFDEVLPKEKIIDGKNIDEVLRRGSGFEGGKYRIQALYEKEPFSSTRVNELKREYGVGGCSFNFTNGESGFVMYDFTGIHIDCYDSKEKMDLTWNAVESAIHKLISSDNYLNEKEKEIYGTVYCQ